MLDSGACSRARILIGGSPVAAGCGNDVATGYPELSGVGAADSPQAEQQGGQVFARVVTREAHDVLSSVRVPDFETLGVSAGLACER